MKIMIAIIFGDYSAVGKLNLGFETLSFVFHSQAVEEEDKMTPEQLAIKNVGKQVRCTVIGYTVA